MTWLPVTGGLTVGDPWLAPDVGGHVTEQVGLGALLRELPPEDLRQRSHRYQPVRIAGEEPARTIWRQGPAWYEIMDMRMIGQSAGPGVQYATHADLAAEVLWRRGREPATRQRRFERAGCPYTVWCERATGRSSSGRVKVTRK